MTQQHLIEYLLLENEESGRVFSLAATSAFEMGVAEGVSRGDLIWQIWFLTASLIEQVHITTAKQIGVTISPIVLMRAQKVFK